MLPAADPSPQPTPEIPAVTHPTYQPGNIFDLSPDGKTLATGISMESHRQFIRLWDQESGAIVNDLSLGSYDRVDTAKFSPDGKMLAVSLGDRQNTFVRLIDTRNGMNIREYWGFEGIAHVQGFTADSRRLPRQIAASSCSSLPVVFAIPRDGRGPKAGCMCGISQSQNSRL
jgi:WD40 repeat protein